MSYLLRGLGSGFGRALGRIIAYILIGFLIYLIFDKLDIDIGSYIKNIKGAFFI